MELEGYLKDVSHGYHLVSSLIKQDEIHAHLPLRTDVWLKGGNVCKHFVNYKIWSM